MIFDLHNDFPTALRRSEYKSYLSARKDAVITAAIWTSEFDRNDAADRIVRIRTALCRLNLPTAIEDLGFAASEKALTEFDFDGMLYCSLTWNYNNGLAGGALDDGDLTNLGRRAVKLMNGRCATDLAHLNKKSFYSVLDAAEKPICSHTGFGSHPRCLDEAQVKALIERNAVIGLCAVKRFTNAETVQALAERIDEFVQRYGNDCLCIGTDFNGTTDLPHDFKDYNGVPTLANCLKRMGHADADIEKIFYSNANRLYEEIENERHL